MWTRRILRTSAGGVLGLVAALPSCAADPEPCLPVVSKDRVEITLLPGTAPCPALGLQAGAVLTATVRDFGPGPIQGECAVNCHGCLFVNVDMDPVADFAWTWLGGLRGEVQGHLGGRYQLTRVDGCTGSMEAALGTDGFSKDGTFRVSYRPDPGNPAGCPDSCINSFPASSRKL